MPDEIRRLTEELARDPRSLAFLRLAELLRRGGRAAQARRVAELGVVRHPDLADAHALLGRVAAELDDLATAGAAWSSAVRLAPGHVDALRGLGFLRARDGRRDDARQFLRRAQAALEPDDARRAAIEHALARLDAAPPAAAPPSVAARTPPATAAASEPAAVQPGASERFHRVGAAVQAAGTGAAREASALAGALELGRWHCVLVESERGLVGLVPGRDGAVEVGAATGLSVGRALRILTQAARTALAAAGAAAATTVSREGA